MTSSLIQAKIYNTTRKGQKTNYSTSGFTLHKNVPHPQKQNSNIPNRYDYEHLKAVRQETDKKIATLKKTLEDCKEMYEVYKDIANTYYSISNGYYVSKLAEKECEKQVIKKSRST